MVRTDLYPLWWYRIQTTVILTTGTILLMWLGEQITDRGIGNGISLVITIGILARLPAMAQGLVDMFLTPGALGEHRYNLFHFIALLLLLFAVIAGVVAVTQAERKIPVQYAQRVVGRKTYSGGSSFMPLRVNYSGVMPVIFASAILMFPAMILRFLGRTYHWKVFDELAQRIAARLAALPGPLWIDDPVFLLLLGRHPVQRVADFRRHEEIRRLHPRRAPRPGDQQLSPSHHEPHHAGGRDLFDDHRRHPDHFGPMR